MRDAGFDHTTHPTGGRTWSFTMCDSAADVFASDPAANTLFSIHMYGVFDTAAEVNDYLTTFVDAGYRSWLASSATTTPTAILTRTRSWPPQSRWGSVTSAGRGAATAAAFEYLDMVTNFDVNSLTDWGERIFNGEDGIAQTAQEASVFDQTPAPAEELLSSLLDLLPG